MHEPEINENQQEKGTHNAKLVIYPIKTPIYNNRLKNSNSTAQDFNWRRSIKNRIQNNNSAIFKLY